MVSGFANGFREWLDLFWGHLSDLVSFLHDCSMGHSRLNFNFSVDGHNGAWVLFRSRVLAMQGVKGSQ